MQNQIPAEAHRPDYNELGRTTSALNDGVDQTVNRLFPDDRENPTLQALKGLVTKYMAASGMGPCTSLAMDGVSAAIDNDPKLMNAALVKTITNVAMHDAEEGSGQKPFADGRAAAQKVLTNIVEKRPDLANATLVKHVVQSATSDPDSETRLNAQRTLSQIAEKRPDLIDADMVKAVKNTATSPVVDHGQRPGDAAPWVRAGKLSGNQWEKIDNEGRETAQDTLKTITAKRPDLVAAPKPVIVKPMVNAKQNGMSLHAVPAAPRPGGGMTP